MTPREYLGSAAVPGGQELKLYRRGGDFMIVLERNELMSSRMSGSEKQLALMTIERLTGRAAPRLLIAAMAWASPCAPLWGRLTRLRG